jgi:Holliday junction resolvasome RuvABC endonuclease subunit
MKNDMTTVLALYPNARGIGYACLENQKKLVDSGVVQVYPISNGKILKRVVKFIAFYKPDLIVVQDCDGENSRYSRRVGRLVDDIVKHSKEIKVPVYRYTREQIRDAFEVFGAKTKDEIAHQITVWFKQLKPLAPTLRKDDGDAEHYNMGIFDALSLAITHNYLTK